MKLLFVLGLILQLLAQLMFSVSPDIVNLLKPIDFIHWTLLIGTAFVIPYSLHFSFGLYRRIGSSFTVVGAISNIGMCAIDLVLWAFRDDQYVRDKLAHKLMSEPSIWPIFFELGPACLMIGLSIQALGYFRKLKIGTVATILGAILIGVGGLILTEIRQVFLLGYFIFVLGLLSIIRKKYDLRIGLNSNSSIQ